MAATSFEGAFAVDRISNLPCDITDHILNNLPLRDVARTSILSREWSSMWFGNAALEELSVCYSDFVLSEEGILVEDYEMPESPGNGLNLFKIFSQLSSIERLEINGRTMQVLALGGAPEKLPNHLDNLALIQLSDIDLGHTDEVACALCLIRSSPNLQRLEIKFETTDNSAPDGAIRYLKSLQKRKTPLSRSLKNIKIENFSGAEPELEFIKLFLSAATVLQKLEIKAGFCESNDEGAWSPRSLLQELESFSPSSSKVAVLFD
ncbi:F-box/FBD/LRR-repeat protein At4g26340-like isoform X3 [Andrographis paniculata]|uniref:F-box/FBD/LRR-repeat protein At4g26340-like isoform X3 n=1 Tax=Andrographis paniculata TaxID=175694 RepID=UPI0021E73729|nr:F-box/FBD/LRR-repeat protein At4g26340-like isoform X3 [Andrographis paniculata]